jgi:glycyl-tRNA synthetase
MIPARLIRLHILFTDDRREDRRKMEKTMDKIVALAKSRGFVYPGSEIYGGLANTWDYGNLGVELKNNVKKAWWQKFVQESPYNVGLDCAILMNPQTWIASGHLGSFSDPLMDCKECHERFRADKIIEDWCHENKVPLNAKEKEDYGSDLEPLGSVDGWSQQQMKDFIEEKKIPCPSCGKHNFTDIRQFNLMFKTFQGVTEDAKNTVYLRPETAQGIFVNFKNVQRTSRKKIPFGIGQIGKSFRNEITPGNFTFRTREFEQMELEFFCKPGTDLDWFSYWKEFCRKWLFSLGMKEEELRFRDHDKAELSFYSRATTDVEYLFPFGWGELWGIADRTDYDLTRHQETSGADMSYFDDETNEKYIPYVIEPSLGADRMVLAFLCAAYDEEVLDAEKNDVRTVLHFHPAIAPVKIGILPLSKKLGEQAEKIHAELTKIWNCEYDDRGNIGKRYRRQDEIGTPYCVTYDFDSDNDHAVTVRNRDTMEQVRVPIEGLISYFHDKFSF